MKTLELREGDFIARDNEVEFWNCDDIVSHFTWEQVRQIIEFLQSVQPAVKPAYQDSSDGNLDKDGCCQLCSMPWHVCLCAHDD